MNDEAWKIHFFLMIQNYTHLIAQLMHVACFRVFHLFILITGIYLRYIKNCYPWRLRVLQLSVSTAILANLRSRSSCETVIKLVFIKANWEFGSNTRYWKSIFEIFLSSWIRRFLLRGIIMNCLGMSKRKGFEPL